MDSVRSPHLARKSQSHSKARRQLRPAGEVRWGLFQEFVFHLRFLDQSLRFAEAGSLAEVTRRFVIGVFLPVGEFLPLLPSSRAT